MPVPAPAPAPAPMPALDPAPEPAPEPTPPPPSASGEQTSSGDGAADPLASPLADPSAGPPPLIAAEPALRWPTDVRHVAGSAWAWSDTRLGHAWLSTAIWGDDGQVAGYLAAPSLSLTAATPRLHAAPLQDLGDSGETGQDLLGRFHVQFDSVVLTGVAVSFSVLAWSARSSMLMASLLVSTPAWRSFDMLPVLGRRGGLADDDARERVTARRRSTARRHDQLVEELL